MALSRLQVTDFRCLQSAELDLDPQFTLISGPNASGKTSLLEAIYVLGRGRSFRTRRLEHLIRHGAERFVVFGEVDTATRRVPMGVEGSRTGFARRSTGISPPRWPSWRCCCRCRSSIRRSITSSRRAPAVGDGSWIGECSTWNQSFVGHWQRYQQVAEAAQCRAQSAATSRLSSRSGTATWLRSGELLERGPHALCGRTWCAGRRAIARNLLGMELCLELSDGLDQGPGAGRSAPAQLAPRSGDRGHAGRAASRGTQHSFGWNAGQGPNIPRPAEAACGRVVDCPDQTVPARLARAAEPVAGRSGRRTGRGAIWQDSSARYRRNRCN